jgi:hypothetical protein
MKTSTYSFNIFCISIFLHVLPAQGMETYWQNALRLRELATRGYVFGAVSEWWNPSYENPQVKELKDTVKSFMQLSATCTLCNWLFTSAMIGNLCKNYDQKIKNQVFGGLVKKTLTLHYDRLPISILVCAGADVKAGYDSTLLLSKAVLCNDVKLVKTLLNHGTNPDSINDIDFPAIPNKEPIFFQAKTEEMARAFIEGKVNVHMNSSWKVNVLWKVIGHEYPSELLELYLVRGADPKKLRSDDTCLWHRIAWLGLNGDDNFLKKVSILLDVIPDMVNALDRDDDTPLDVAQRNVRRKEYDRLANEQCIALLRKNGALTVHELRQSKSYVSFG